jgi:RNA polymerase sigma factor (sigma-70 family)
MERESTTGAGFSAQDPASGVSTPVPERWFVTTDWGTILAAGQPGSPEADAALARLCQIYWRPLYGFIRGRGHSPEDSQDLVQGFFAHVLEKNCFGDYVAEKGRFRSFLMLMLKRFMTNEWRRENRQKRGGGRELLSIDAMDTEAQYLNEPVDKSSPEKDFQRRWAMTLLKRVLERLEAECCAAGKAESFRELKNLLSGEPGGVSCAEVGRKLGMGEGAVKVAVHRLRQRYRDLLRAEVAATVSSRDEVDDEIRSLFLDFD